MVIKNTSAKIINIGTKVLLPGDTYKAPKAICEASSVLALVKTGQREIIEEKAAAAEQKVENMEKESKDTQQKTEDTETIDSAEKKSAEKKPREKKADETVEK